MDDLWCGYAETAADSLIALSSLGKQTKCGYTAKENVSQLALQQCSHTVPSTVLVLWTNLILNMCGLREDTRTNLEFSAMHISMIIGTCPSTISRNACTVWHNNFVEMKRFALFHPLPVLLTHQSHPLSRSCWLGRGPQSLLDYDQRGFVGEWIDPFTHGTSETHTNAFD